MKTKSKKLIPFIVIIGLFSIWIFMILIEGNVNKRRSEKYIKIEHITSLNGTVSEVKIIKGYSYLKIRDTLLVVYPSLNYNYKKEYFSDIVKKGDEIVKSAGSDTIILIQDDKKYIFKNNSVINK